jgi:hypothetical protein
MNHGHVPHHSNVAGLLSAKAGGVSSCRTATGMKPTHTACPHCAVPGQRCSRAVPGRRCLNSATSNVPHLACSGITAQEPLIAVL